MMNTTTRAKRVQGERGWTVVEFGALVLVTLDRNSSTVSFKKSELSDRWVDAYRFGFSTEIGVVLVKAAALADEMEG